MHGSPLNGNMMYLTYHVTSSDHMFKGLSDFMVESLV